jgi:hypothetical protein
MLMQIFFAFVQVVCGDLMRSLASKLFSRQADYNLSSDNPDFNLPGQLRKDMPSGKIGSNRK